MAKQQLYIPGESAAVLNGYLIPGASYLNAIVDQLRVDLRNDSQLAERWEQNPREVLGERGVVRDLQSEILKEQGLPVEEAAAEWCISTGSCCCETL